MSDTAGRRYQRGGGIHWHSSATWRLMHPPRRTSIISGFLLLFEVINHGAIVWGPARPLPSPFSLPPAILITRYRNPRASPWNAAAYKYTLGSIVSRKFTWRNRSTSRSWNLFAPRRTPLPPINLFRCETRRLPSPWLNGSGITDARARVSRGARGCPTGKSLGVDLAPLGTTASIGICPVY